MKKLEAFFFKYFSESTKDSEDSWVRWAFAILLLAIGMGVAITDSNGYEVAARVLVYIFNAIFVPFGVLWIIVWFYHNWRIKNNK